MAQTERQMVEAARDKFRKAEALIASGNKDVVAVVKFNQAAGKAALMNAASIALGELEIGLGSFRKAHGAATEILLENWPGFADEVTTLGPGR